MPEPKFLLGAEVRLGIDAFGSIPRQMEGKIVQIDYIHPFNKVRNAFFYDVHVVGTDVNARVREDHIETMVL